MIRVRVRDGVMDRDRVRIEIRRIEKELDPQTAASQVDWGRGSVR